MVLAAMIQLGIQKILQLPFGISSYSNISASIGLVSTFLLLVIILIPPPANILAQSGSDETIANKENNFNTTLSVSGNAITKIRPDRVFISLGVETTDTTANGSLAANSLSMNKALSALRNLGLMENETSTSVFSIFPNYNYTDSGTRLNITGFTVTNSIQIESSKTDNVSSWIDTAVAAGVNSINTIEFTISNEKLEDTKNMLIEEAISNARQMADIASAAVGLEVIGVESLFVEGNANIPPPDPFMAREALAQPAGSSGPSPTPILAGERQASANVDIVYLIG
jgi:uncharacterized protein YggE